jgi:hypothetical protein
MPQSSLEAVPSGMVNNIQGGEVAISQGTRFILFVTPSKKFEVSR